MIAMVGPFYASFTVRPVQDALTLLKNASELVMVFVRCIKSEASTVEIARQVVGSSLAGKESRE
jgi:hypothetical protein